MCWLVSRCKTLSLKGVPLKMVENQQNSCRSVARPLGGAIFQPSKIKLNQV